MAGVISGKSYLACVVTAEKLENVLIHVSRWAGRTGPIRQASVSLLSKEHKHGER